MDSTRKLWIGLGTLLAVSFPMAPTENIGASGDRVFGEAVRAAAASRQ